MLAQGTGARRLAQAPPPTYSGAPTITSGPSGPAAPADSRARRRRPGRRAGPPSGHGPPPPVGVGWSASTVLATSPRYRVIAPPAGAHLEHRGAGRDIEAAPDVRPLGSKVILLDPVAAARRQLVARRGPIARATDDRGYPAPRHRRTRFRVRRGEACTRAATAARAAGGGEGGSVRQGAQGRRHSS